MFFSAFVRGLLRGERLGFLFQVNDCLCFCEHRYIGWLQKVQRSLLVKPLLSRTVPIFYRKFDAVFV